MGSRRIASDPEHVAVVTGASSGIGEATAALLARDGFCVVLVARRSQRLRRLARQITAEGGRALVIPADLSRESERRRAFRGIMRRLSHVDVLINSAGFGWYGFVSQMNWSTARGMLRINVEATSQLTMMFLRPMLRRGQGHIITIGSVAGGIPSQGVALYGATKAFLDNFMTAAHRELKGTGVHVSVVRPGPVRTEFGEAARRHTNGLRVPTLSLGVSPERVAIEIGRLLRRPKRVVYIPFWLRIVPWIELIFGWIIDLIGPLLLRRQAATRRE